MFVILDDQKFIFAVCYKLRLYCCSKPNGGEVDQLFCKMDSLDQYQ